MLRNYQHVRDTTLRPYHVQYDVTNLFISGVGLQIIHHRPRSEQPHVLHLAVAIEGGGNRKHGPRFRQNSCLKESMDHDYAKDLAREKSRAMSMSKLLLERNHAGSRLYQNCCSTNPLDRWDPHTKSKSPRHYPRGPTRNNYKTHRTRTKFGETKQLPNERGQERCRKAARNKYVLGKEQRMRRCCFQSEI